MSVRGYQLAFDFAGAGEFTGPYDDVTGYVLADDPIVVSWGRDANSDSGHTSAGKLTFSLNNDSRLFSPENSASPVSALLLPGLKVRYTDTDPDGAIRTRMLGAIDDYDADPMAPAKTFTATVLDGWGWTGAKALSTPVYQGIRTGDAIGLILDAAGWTGLRDLDPGATVIPIWWEEGTGAPDAIEKVLDSEGPPALAYISGGTFIFRDRHHRLLDATSVNAQTLFTHRVPAAGSLSDAADAFERTVAAGSFGTADTGGTWALTGTASDFSVAGGYGRVGISAVNSERVALLATPLPDVTVRGAFHVLATSTGAAQNVYLVARYINANNQYRARLAFQTSGTLAVGLEKIVGGSLTIVVALIETGISYGTGGTEYPFVFQVWGSTLRAKVWDPAGDEPIGWNFEVTDTDLTPAAAAVSSMGVRWILSTGNTNTLPAVMKVDDFTAVPDLKMSEPISYDHGLRNIFNAADFSVDVRAPTAEAVDEATGLAPPVWSTDQSFNLSANEVQVLTVSAEDPFINAVTPVSNIDYVSTGTLTVSLSRTSGQSTTLTLTAGGSPVLVTGMALRATPLKVVRTVKVSASDAGSIGRFGIQQWDRPVPWCNVYDAQAIANRIVAIYASNRPRMTFAVVNLSDTYERQMFARMLSDRVRIRDDVIGVDRDFIIEQITHENTGLGIKHVVVFGCEATEPTQPANVFTFDVAGKGFNDGAFGVDGIDSAATVFRFDVAGQGFDLGRFAT